MPTTHTGAGAVTLKRLFPFGQGLHEPPFATAVGVVTLKLLSISGSGTLVGPTYSGSGSVTLPRIAITGVGGKPKEIGSASVLLPRLAVNAVGLNPQYASVGTITANPRQIKEGGSSVLTFLGPPNVAIAWFVLSGSATIVPGSLGTDQNGMAYAVMTSTGFVGEVEVAANYG